VGRNKAHPDRHLRIGTNGRRLEEFLEEMLIFRVLPGQQLVRRDQAAVLGTVADGAIVPIRLIGRWRENLERISEKNCSRPAIRR